MNDQDTIRSESEDSTDDDELRLQPIVRRPESPPPAEKIDGARDRQRATRTVHKERYRRNPHTSLYALDSSVLRSTDTGESLLRPSRNLESHAEASRSERHHSTAKSLQNLYRLIGYVTAVTGPLFLVYRFVSLLFFSDEDLASEFSAFTLYAFWMMVGTVFVSATLFSLAEIFQLLIDVESDTLAESKSQTSDA